MLPKNRRMKKADFSSVFAVGQNIHSENFIVKISGNKDLPSRFAVSFSKKIGYSSVQRHLVKRRIYSIIRRKIGDSFVKEGLFLIFIVKKDVLEIPYSKLMEEVKQIIAKF